MPGSTPAPSFTRISIGVTTITQNPSGTNIIFRCTGNSDPGFVAGDTATISGNSVVGYNTDHTVIGTGSDGTGPYVICNTPHTSNGSGGAVTSQKQPIVDMIGKSGANNVQIVRSGSQHILSLLEGGQGGGGGGGGSGNTLDTAYDQGGAGSGRAVTVDSGAITLTTPASAGSGTLAINSDEGGQPPLAITHTNPSGTVTAPAVRIEGNKLDTAAVEILDVFGAVTPTATGTSLFTVKGGETVVNDSKVDHDFRIECLSSVSNGPHTVSNSLVHEASTGRLGLGVSAPVSALQVKHKGATAGITVTGTESSGNSPYLALENTYTKDQRGSGSSFLFVIQPNPSNSGSGGTATVTGAVEVSSSGYVQAGSLSAAGETGIFRGWLHRMDNGFAVGVIDPTATNLETTCAAIGDHTTSAGITERSLVVGRNNTVNDNALAVGHNCVALTNSIAVGEAATTVGYPNAPVIALNNGSSASGSGGSTANTVIIDSGNQAPGGAISIGGAGGNGNVYLEAGVFASGAADYAEMFEWADGNSKNNPNNAVDRRGLFVHLDASSSTGLQDSTKIMPGYIPASAKFPLGSPPIGVVSGRPVILGDAGELQWTQAHEVDDFGATKYQIKAGKKVPKTNPAYNPNKTYQPRSQRVEWTAVGMLGKLFVRTSGVQPINAGDYVTPDPATGMAVLSPPMGPGTKSNYPTPHAAHQSGTEFHYLVLRVMRQATPQQYGIVEILLK